jgi:hypothetical protein
VSTYKLIQDIEAEDHILGPLSLRQFIFALIAAFLFYLCFLVTTKHVAFLLIVFLPPALFFGFFALPFGRDQPTEVWALAKLRFWFKPRKRVWDQSGVKELVKINAPKKIERVLTNGLNQYEVKSRLSALANTLDSRGWAVKNTSMSPAYVVNSYVVGNNASDSDRLIDMNGVPDQVSDYQEPSEVDILDEVNSPVSQHFDQMITQTSQAHRQQLIQQMNSVTPEPPQASSIPSDNQWFMPHMSNNAPIVTAPDIEAQDVGPGEAALGLQLKAQHDAQQVFSSNMRTLQPLGSQPSQPEVYTAQTSTIPTPQQVIDTNNPQPVVADQKDPAIISLANNNDFTVETLARQAKIVKDGENDNNEVVISLH